MEVAAGRPAGVVDAADPLAGGDPGALRGPALPAHVHVGVVLPGALAVDDDVVAGRRLVLAGLDAAGMGGDDRPAALRERSWPWWPRPAPKPSP